MIAILDRRFLWGAILLLLLPLGAFAQNKLNLTPPETPDTVLAVGELGWPQASLGGYEIVRFVPRKVMRGELHADTVLLLYGPGLTKPATLPRKVVLEICGNTAFHDQKLYWPSFKDYPEGPFLHAGIKPYQGTPVTFNLTDSSFYPYHEEAYWSMAGQADNRAKITPGEHMVFTWIMQPWKDFENGYNYNWQLTISTERKDLFHQDAEIWLPADSTDIAFELVQHGPDGEEVIRSECWPMSGQIYVKEILPGDWATLEVDLACPTADDIHIPKKWIKTITFWDAERAKDPPHHWLQAMQVNFDALSNKSERVYFNGYPYTGVAREYHSNGHLFRELGFWFGNKQGLAEHWNEDGQLVLKGVYHNDARHGRFLEFHPDGRPWTEKHFDMDTPDGLWREWYADGTVKMMGHYTDGKKDGKFEYRDEQGILTKEETWELGELKMVREDLHSGTIEDELDPPPSENPEE